MLSWANARNKHFPTEQAVFKQLYPTIYQFITVLKGRRYLPREGAVRKKAEKMVEKGKDKFTEKFQQHKKISHLFLQSESHIMLDNIARKLNKSQSKIPFFTLHDCIVTTKENIVELEQFMKDTFTVLIGFSPNFKTKIFE
jgi:ribosomal protein S17E